MKYQKPIKSYPISQSFPFWTIGWSQKQSFWERVKKVWAPELIQVEIGTGHKIYQTESETI